MLAALAGADEFAGINAIPRLPFFTMTCISGFSNPMPVINKVVFWTFVTVIFVVIGALLPRKMGSRLAAY